MSVAGGVGAGGRARLATARELARDHVSALLGYARERTVLAGIERYVMFVGYPRSGHSLVGSLLNAHPDVVVAHELDALRYVRAHFTRGQLFALLLVRDRDFEAHHGRAPGRYDYRVPGQWQGRVRQLRVIGDKKGGATTGRLARSPELLERLRATVRLPLRIVHVTRSPFDNIAAIHRMERRRRGFSLERAVDFYFELADANAALEARVATEEWLELSHDDLVDAPADALRRLCAFLDVEPAEDFVRDGAAIVHASPHRARASAPWSDELVEDVRRRATRYRFLERYAADDWTPAAVTT